MVVRSTCEGDFLLSMSWRTDDVGRFQTLVMIILVPLPLFFASTVYGVAGFTTWVIVSIIWTFVSATTVVLYPLYESRTAITRICVGIVKVCCVIFPGVYVYGTEYLPYHRTSLEVVRASIVRKRPSLRLRR